MKFPLKTILAGAAALALIATTTTASAQRYGGYYSDSNVSIGFSTGSSYRHGGYGGFSGGFVSYGGYCPPARPVYVSPAPVYYAPQPVYYSPAPVYYAPPPVYYSQPAYCPPPARVYASYSWY